MTNDEQVVEAVAKWLGEYDDSRRWEAAGTEARERLMTDAREVLAVARAAEWQARVNEMLERVEQVHSTRGFPVEQPVPREMTFHIPPQEVALGQAYREGYHKGRADVEDERREREAHQPAPTVAPSVAEIATVIRDWLLDHLPPHRPEQMAEAVAAADPRRTEAEVKAEALEEAADNVRASDWYTSWKVDNYAGTIRHWLRARADRLREGR